MTVLHEALFYVPAQKRSDFISKAWPVLLFAAVGAALVLMASLGIDVSASMDALS